MQRISQAQDAESAAGMRAHVPSASFLTSSGRWGSEPGNFPPGSDCSLSSSPQGHAVWVIQSSDDSQGTADTLCSGLRNTNTTC